MLKLGIDDAGRGPVIGPMILSGVLIDETTGKEFKEQGVKDSKQLTPKRREILATIIKKKALAFKVVTSSASEIDAKINSGINLNRIEAIKAAEIINKITKANPNVKMKVIIDCPSPNIPAWQKMVSSNVENTSNLVFAVEHKADINHIACSAASVLAKSKREKEVKKIKKELGVDFGSGYAADPITCKFLTEYSKKFKDSGIFRKTWATWKNACGEKEQKKLKEFK